MSASLSRRPPARVHTALRTGRPTVTVLQRSSQIAPRVIGSEDGWLRVALVGCSMMLLGGDDVEIEVHVGAGTRLQIVEPAGIVAYRSDGLLARYATRVTVESGAALHWRAQPFVVAERAHVVREAVVQVAEDGAAEFHETLALGRTGEARGTLTSTLEAWQAGRPELLEHLELGPSSGLGVLPQGARVLATAIWIGSAIPAATDLGECTIHRDDVRASRSRLSHGGLAVRAMGMQAHMVERALNECCPTRDLERHDSQPAVSVHSAVPA